MSRIYSCLHANPNKPKNVRHEVGDQARCLGSSIPSKENKTLFHFIANEVFTCLSA